MVILLLLSDLVLLVSNSRSNLRCKQKYAGQTRLENKDRVIKRKQECLINSKPGLEPGTGHQNPQGTHGS